MRTFEQELAAARATAEDRADPVWCILRAVAEHYGLTSDPLDERGSKGPWYTSGRALDDAAKLLYTGLGWTKAQVAQRLGMSQGATPVYNAKVTWDDHECDLYTRAEELHGGELWA